MSIKNREICKPKRAAVKLYKITTDPRVYQPRQDGINHGHLTNLVAILKRGDELDPISVRKTENGQLVVLDGHHSLEAYRLTRWHQSIPVLVYTCSEAEGQLVAIRENSKHRLQMTDEDRSDWAWRLTCQQPTLSKTEVSRICNRSTSTVGRMRPVRDKLLEADVVLPQTWKAAQRACREVDHGEFDEDRAAQWREDTIAKIREQISGAISPFAQWNSDIVLEAVWLILGENRFRLALEQLGFHEGDIDPFTGEFMPADQATPDNEIEDADHPF